MPSQSAPVLRLQPRAASWFDPSDESSSIILPRHFITRDSDDSFVLHEKLVIFETRDGFDYVKTTYGLSATTSTLRCFLNTPTVYSLNGVSMVEGGFGAAAAVDLLEVAIAAGCKQVFIFGLAGGIDDDLDVGDLILPSEVVREEGTSYHYSQPGQTAKPDKNLLQTLSAYFTHYQQLTVTRGATVSTDAPFRQTLNKELHWQKSGVLGVDMGLSALLTVAAYRTIPAVGLLVISDKHHLNNKEDWKFGGKNFKEQRNLAIDALIDFAITYEDKQQ
ncbi:MAG: nucleoside phosphorylase [Chloroflexota bacterium]